MNKFLSGVVAASLLLSACSPVKEVQEFVKPKNEVIHVVVNEKLLTFDVPPLINEGRTYVPLRGIFEAFGAEVQFNEPTCDVIVKKGNRTILLHTGTKNEGASPFAVVDGKVVKMNSPAKVVNGRTLVPVRFVGEVFGADVQWIGQNQTVRISTKESKEDVVNETLRIFGQDVPKTLIRKGYKYAGSLSNELPNGKGILLDYRLNPIFEGTWKNGVPHGEGNLNLGNDIVLKGSFINGTPTKGKLFKGDILIYEGTFYSSTKVKSGKLRLAMGVVFKGEFTSDQSQATGVIYTDAGSKLYSGKIQLQGSLFTGDFTYKQIQ
jgi:hypothetical protein